MAQRKSATKTEARERARRAAAESMAREQRLLELGEEFFVAQGEAEQEAARTKEAQSRVVAGMKGERVTVPEIAQRLELSVAEVRALLREGTAGKSHVAEDSTIEESAPAQESENASAPETVNA